jgi:uncharacterized membrane protein YphA (DoxX/SURF4 family)
MTLPAAPLSSEPRSRSTGPHARAARPHNFDIGLFILRTAALLVLGTWGWMKFHSLINMVHSGRPLANSGFVRLVRQLGFPFPRFMAISAIINESVVAALLFLGIVTRPAAVIGALGMAGAWYSSIRLGEEPLRAALCTLIFATLAFTGAGRFSADQVLWRKHSIPAWCDDFGLFVLRVGVAIASIALAIAPTAKDPNLLAFVPAAHWPLVLACSGAVIVAFGMITRAAAGTLSIFWLCAVLAGLQNGSSWNMSPIRAALFAAVFGALAFTGPGRISITAIHKGRMQAAEIQPELN